MQCFIKEERDHY